MFKKILAFLLCITAVLCLCSCENINAPIIDVNPNGALNVHFIDVGQGDCTLLESNGKFVLIDAGETEYGDVVCEYLKHNDVKTIDYVIATHPHSDHCGGLTKVIDTFDCKNFITKESDQQTNVWLDVLNAVDNNDVNYIDAKVGATYSFGESKFEILGPYKDSYDNYNNYSIVLKASCGDTSFLFAGDAETLVETELLNNGANLDADMLKISHHGSHSSSSKSFLSAVSPECAVISCGKDNDYGHPHKETLDSLKLLNIKTFRTDTLSTIIASSDKTNITVYYNEGDAVKQSTFKRTTHAPLEYIGNTNSKKFHLSSCESAKQMNSKNKTTFNSRDDAVAKGYSPCKSCNP